MAETTKIVRGEKSEVVVMPYRPKAFPLQISADAQTFVLGQQMEDKTDFVISHLVADRVGITDIHRQTLEQTIRAEALEKLKVVEEEAYKEAFELGLIEGTEKAFGEKKKEFSDRLIWIDRLLEKMEKVLQLVVEQKERQLIEFVFHIGKRLALREIQAQPEMIVDLVKQVVAEIETEEQIVVKVSQADMMFIESLQERIKGMSAKLNSVRLEAHDEVQPGGCVLETNHGMIDASIETRAARAWELIKDKLPKLKEDIA